MSRTPEHIAWLNMLNRCFNENHPQFSYYGARGITVCQEWATDFMAFFKDMGTRPSPAHSLERKDNSAGYGPSNCIWATFTEQMRNVRSNHWIEIDGERKLLVDWAREKDIDSTTIIHRIERGMSERDAVMVPPQFIGRRASKKTKDQHGAMIAADAPLL